MKMKNISRYTIVLSILLIAAVLVFLYFYNHKKLIGDVLPKDITSETEYIKIFTVENNMYPRSIILTDKDEIRKFYEWLSNLRYKGIHKSLQELKPGTEYAIKAYDNSDKPIINMPYTKTDFLLEVENKVYYLEEDIHSKLDSYIYK
jgi:hypothetical protein